MTDWNTIDKTVIAAILPRRHDVGWKYGLLLPDAVRDITILNRSGAKGLY
jgi:hypothetical protein